MDFHLGSKNVSISFPKMVNTVKTPSKHLHVYTSSLVNNYYITLIG